MSRCKRPQDSLMYWKRDNTGKSIQRISFSFSWPIAKALSWTLSRDTLYASTLTKSTYKKKKIIIATWSCSSGYGKEKGSRLSQNILISRDNRSWILKWQFKHRRGKNILRSTGPGLWAVSVLLQLRLRMLMVGLGIYWVRTDLLILARVFMGHQYGSQVMNYYPTRQHQWLVIHLHLGSWRKKRKKKKRHLNVFDVCVTAHT